MNLVKLIIGILVLSIVTACSGAMAEPPFPDPTPTADPGNPGEPGLRSEVYINSASLLIMESFPVQIRALIQGDLPTPCHMLKYNVANPDSGNAIHIEMFSIAEEGAVCIQMLQPFEESVSIPMEGQVDGAYKVFLNGDFVGEFNYPGG
ncbi:MAG: hypothetical protein EPO32_02585 [Anaerolineae bacterium]|nr:MAG: hypothetical protein EPO32_02585 [Anaerolineae bacterium]